MTAKKSERAEIIQPYLFFNGRCDEALEFYKKTLGAEVTMRMLFKEMPEPAMCPPGMGDKVCHASFNIGKNVIMASDGCGDNKAKFEGFSLCITVPTEGDAERYFAALADGGKVQMPLEKTFYSPRFGMVADRFGVSWMIMVGTE